MPNAEKDAPQTPAGGHPTTDHSVCRVARCGEAATAPPAGQYDESQAWQDNYDGMFARWAECDRERLEWKQRALDAEALVRLQREELATRVFPPGESPDQVGET